MTKVFLSYVREDTEMVERLAHALRRQGIDVWLDRDSLLLGHRWAMEIRRGIRQGDFFIACFSDSYYSRTKTYMNEELNIALEELRLRPASQAWFIPVLLSDCEVPDLDIGAGQTLQSIHWVALFHDWEAGIQRILSVVAPDQDRVTSQTRPVSEMLPSALRRIADFRGH